VGRYKSEQYFRAIYGWPLINDSNLQNTTPTKSIHDMLDVRLKRLGKYFGRDRPLLSERPGLRDVYNNLCPFKDLHAPTLSILRFKNSESHLFNIFRRDSLDVTCSGIQLVTLLDLGVKPPNI
jgi:hypothetical protein